MSQREQREPHRGRAWEPAAWFFASLVLYASLTADTFYKTDGPDIVRLLDAHLQTGAPLQHPWHVGFLPLLDAFRRGLLMLGWSTDYVRLTGLFSALGAAIGVAFAVAGLHRLVAAPAARLAAMAFALNPGTLLFATVAEYHGPLLAPLGVAFWWTAVQVGRPSWVGMVVLGGLCHAAFLVHGQALFFPVWLLCFFVVRRWPRHAKLRRTLVFAAIAGATHAVLWLLLPRLLPWAYGMWSDLGEGFRTEASIGRPQSLDYTPTILWQEWLWPLLPVSVLVVVAPLRRFLRAEFAAFVVGAAPFLYVSVRQLVFEPEFGAYMLPMVLPAALLVAQAMENHGGRWLVAALALGAWPAWTGPRLHFVAQRAFDSAFLGAVRAAAGPARPFVLVGSHREMAAAYATLGLAARQRDPVEEEQMLWVRSNASMRRDKVIPENLTAVASFLQLLHGKGRAVLITQVALDSLDDPRAAMLAEKSTLVVPANETMAGPLFAEHLRAHFDLLPAAAGMLRLVPKS